MQRSSLVPLQKKTPIYSAPPKTPLTLKVSSSQKSSLSKLPPLKSSASSVKLEKTEIPETSETPKTFETLNALKMETIEFSNFQGIPPQQDIEKSLLDKGFISTEKILTKDDNGHVVCHFIKARDKVGHSFYIELDTTCDDGMGFLTVSDNDTILTQTNEASVIPYSLKVGSFEASSNDLYGVGFECDDSVCIMSRKDNSLDPVETVFTRTKNTDNDMGIQNNHPVPFPVVKMTEILVNPSVVQEKISISHNRMRNVAVNSCIKDVEIMKHNLTNLDKEVHRFDEISTKVSNTLSHTIDELETMHQKFEKRGVRNPEEEQKKKSIQFNLNKRHDLFTDHIALCHSMRERSAKIAALVEEIKSLNNFAEALFDNLGKVFVE